MVGVINPVCITTQTFEDDPKDGLECFGFACKPKRPGKSLKVHASAG
jgi:hypothetical protein